MMTRCTLIDGSEKIGYANPFRTHDNKVHDYIFLWICDNLDEKSHKLIVMKKINIIKLLRELILMIL